MMLLATIETDFGRRFPARDRGLFCGQQEIGLWLTNRWPHSQQLGRREPRSPAGSRVRNAKFRRKRSESFFRRKWMISAIAWAKPANSN